MKGNVGGKGEVTEFFKRKINSPFLNRVSQQTFMATSSLKQKNLCSAENSKLASGSSIWGTAHADLEESLETAFYVLILQQNGVPEMKRNYVKLTQMEVRWKHFFLYIVLPPSDIAN